MTSALLKMNAFVQVAEGMNVYYDGPMMSGEDYRSDAFFKKYRGMTGRVKGFPEKFVGPLDSKGCWPGVYIKPGYIHVKFEGEEKVHQGLNLHHFILLDVGQTVVPTASLEHQKVRDLPEPIEFWPGDQVHKANDLLHGTRFVEDVRIGDDGVVTYVLSEITEAQQQRQSEKEAEITKHHENTKKSDDPMAGFRLGVAFMDHPRTENCKASDLSFVARGNVYHLYHDPSQLAFTSPQEEVTFWGKDGVSRTVYSIYMQRYEWPLDDAKKLVEKGEGDLVIASKQYENVIVTGRGGDFKVRKLHPCFAQHSERVRMLSLSLAKPPVEIETYTKVIQ